MLKEEEIRDLISRGVAIMAAGKYAEARSVFDKVLESDPKNYDAYIHKGNACADMNDMDGAENAFKLALMLRPDDGHALYSLGNVAFLRGNAAAAVKYYNRAESAGYVSIDMYKIMAELFAQAGDYIQASRCMTRAIEINPLRGDLWSDKVSIQIRSGRTDAALETLTEYQKILPDAYDAYDMQVQVFCAQKKYEEAQAAADMALTRFPNDARVKLLRLKILIESERFGDAKNFAESVRGMEMDKECFRELSKYEATACAKLKEPEEVVRVLEACCEGGMDDPLIIYLLMNTYAAVNDMANMKRVAGVLRDMDAEAPLVAAGKFYYAYAVQQLDPDKAKTEYKRAAGELRRMTITEPGLYEAYIYRLMCHRELNEYDKALDLADYLLNAQPKLADGHAFKYSIYKKMGDEQKAEQEKKLALAVDPSVRL